MCKPVTCRVCGKTTWSGCGKHIDQVRRDVPADQWCDGPHTDPPPAASRANDPAANQSATEPKPNWLARLIGSYCGGKCTVRTW